SYFARDAKYSNSYTDDSDVKSMFIARVLVGDFTKGSTDYRRPPSKDGGDVNFYDSCVDNVIDPSIFVVFEKHQIYPEYLLQYKTTHPRASLYSTTTVTAQRPVPAQRPAAIPSRVTAQPAVSANQRITSSYQLGSPTYQPTTSVRPSAPSYQASTSVQRSTPVQPSASSYQRSTSAQPSTSSYSTLHYQPTHFSKPSSPTPPPKKNDSCVIA
ncbi:adhesive plaque matrix protein-like, partial [Seriola lalandi dorsalis]